MSDFRFIKLRERAELAEKTAEWFHSNWGIPVEAYSESIADCINNVSPVPQWYIVMNGSDIVAWLGLIENDFHARKDLTPNICAVYVDVIYRNRGIAGKMLNFACTDMKENGVDTMYLLTDHEGFYERYGWKFFCMAQGDGEEQRSRMYIHKMNRDKEE